jgi:Spy/CpxP family protein refolding chaperone
MYIHEKNGNYVDAEKSRLKIEQLRKDLEARTLFEMDHRHKREVHDLRKANDDELAAFNDYWNKKAADISSEGSKADHEMTLRHKQDHANTRKALEEEFSLKVKESS